jgi:hypothetical protein
MTSDWAGCSAASRAPSETSRSCSASKPWQARVEVKPVLGALWVRDGLEPQPYEPGRTLNQHAGVVLGVSYPRCGQPGQLGVVVGRDLVPIEGGSLEPGQGRAVAAVEDVVDHGHHPIVIPLLT